jgi:hypothetical protein
MNIYTTTKVEGCKLIGSPKFRSPKPTEYRLVRKASGDMILQGGYTVQEGFNKMWMEWEDMETINE